MNPTRILRGCVLLCALGLIVASCNEIGFHVPPSPKGEKGKDGQSAYEAWKDQVEKGLVHWPGNTLADYMAYLKGKEGDRGKDGLSAYESWKEMVATGEVTHPHHPNQKWPATRNTEADFWLFLTGRDGATPHIGENGHWWVGKTDTNIPAQGPQGPQGMDGRSAYEAWKAQVAAGNIAWDGSQTDLNDFFRYLKGKPGDPGLQGLPGVDGAPGAPGQDATSPHIGNNGHWWVGTTDTGIVAQGSQGPQGDAGTNGTNGTNGLSAYEVWKADLATRCGTGTPLPTPATGTPWDCDRNTLADYFAYLVGAVGAKGLTGDNGNDGRNGTNGRSAFQVWVDLVNAGGVKNPLKPNEDWPTDAVSMNDFYRFLSGKDGADGLSAYELWKKELAEKAGTVNQLLDKYTYQPWPVDRNSIDDFFRYHTGVDGTNGTNGTDGANGTNGRDGVVIERPA